MVSTALQISHADNALNTHCRVMAPERFLSQSRYVLHVLITCNLFVFAVPLMQDDPILETFQITDEGKPLIHLEIKVR